MSWMMKKEKRIQENFLDQSEFYFRSDDGVCKPIFLVWFSS